MRKSMKQLTKKMVCLLPAFVLALVLVAGLSVKTASAETAEVHIYKKGTSTELGSSISLTKGRFMASGYYLNLNSRVILGNGEEVGVIEDEAYVDYTEDDYYYTVAIKASKPGYLYSYKHEYDDGYDQGMAKNEYGYYMKKCLRDIYSDASIDQTSVALFPMGKVGKVKLIYIVNVFRGDEGSPFASVTKNITVNIKEPNLPFIEYAKSGYDSAKKYYAFKLTNTTEKPIKIMVKGAMLKNKNSAYNIKLSASVSSVTIQPGETKTIKFKGKGTYEGKLNNYTFFSSWKWNNKTFTAKLNYKYDKAMKKLRANEWIGVCNGKSYKLWRYVTALH